MSPRRKPRAGDDDSPESSASQSVTPPVDTAATAEDARERSVGAGRAPVEAQTFEAAFAELQRVVEQLETGGLDLERTVRLFDRGTALAQGCEQLVEDAELRITRLTAETASPLSDA